jgi:hypothetical protein
MNNEPFIAPAGGYGRLWESVYEGSMVGSGPEVFCLWPYVVAKMRKDAEHGATVLLNPGLLGAVFGVSDERFVRVGIEKLCDVDPKTKNGKDEDGRRLVHISGYLYRVVNGAAYMAIRSKESHVAAQKRYREKKKSGKTPLQKTNDERERRFIRALGDGDEVAADRIAAEGIPDTNGK